MDIRQLSFRRIGITFVSPWLLLAGAYAPAYVGGVWEYGELEPLLTTFTVTWWRYVSLLAFYLVFAIWLYESVEFIRHLGSLRAWLWYAAIPPNVMLVLWASGHTN